MKKLMLILAATTLLAGSAQAEWDFDVHGAEIAKPRMALSQAQRAMFLAGLELEMPDPVPVVLNPLEKALKTATEVCEKAAETLNIEAATK